MSKKCLITGISGQDSAYLSQLLLEKGYKVYGAARRTASGDMWRLRALGIENDVEIVTLELAEQSNIDRIIRTIKPDEVYNLAAMSFVGTSFDCPTYTSDINGLGVTRILESIRNFSPKTKFYQASTSEMMGKVQEVPQNENSRFYPRSPYGVAKLYAHWMTKNYRESYGMFCCSGILYNHESKFRSKEFVTRKITSSIAQIMKGKLDCLELGNLKAKRDWGHAKDFTRGMYLMMQHDTPDDYVLATGKMHTVQEFVEAAFRAVGQEIKWHGDGQDQKGFIGSDCVVSVNPKFYRPCEVDELCGNAFKARKVLGWKPEISFEQLVEEMVKYDMEREV